LQRGILVGMRVIVAARLSKLVNGQTGLDTQDEDAQEWAEENNHEVIATVADHKSGTIAPWKRPNLKPWVTQPDLMASYDGIVAAKQDRLSRAKWRDEADIRRWAEDNGKTLFIVDRNMQWPPEDEADVSRWNDGADSARREWVSISKRYRRMQRKQRESGYLVGRAPYGFRIIGEAKAKSLTPDEITAPIIREAANRYLAGDSLQVVCEHFNRRAVPSPAGARWDSKILSQVLRNPAIAGRRDNGAGMTLRCEPLISLTDYRAIIARMDERSTRKGVALHNASALLTGILVCQNCKRAMYRIKGRTGEYSYYCRNCPKGMRPLLPMGITDKLVEAQIIARIRYDDYEVSTTLPAASHEDEIEQTKQDIRDLDVMAEDYDARLAERRAELKRLVSLPDEPRRVVTKTVSGQVLAGQWSELTDAAKRAQLLSIGCVVAAGRNASGELEVCVTVGNP
jgi:site-specific DNA recombinase